MTVVANGDDELTAFVGDPMRSFVVEALDVEMSSAEQGVAETGEEAERVWFRARVMEAKALRVQLEQTSGRAQLTGPTELVADIIKDATSLATQALDVFVEYLKGVSEPLSDRDVAELRTRAAAVTSGVESVLACESSRRIG